MKKEFESYGDYFHENKNIKFKTMKNIYLSPTDKPSRLFIIDKSKMFLSEPPYLSFSKVGGRVHKIEDSELYQPQNIYITNDEEIKEGDWTYFISTNEIVKVPKGGFKGKVCKKIILTTDQSLDSVQSINDTFLEWFVKNPSCEEVEVVSEKRHWKEINWVNVYKIIIPQEEPKQESNIIDDWLDKHTTEEERLAMKKRIGEEYKDIQLEQSAERFLKEGAREFKTAKQVLIDFAKLQEQRIYNDITDDSIDDWLDYRITTKNKLSYIEWFKKFKKK